MPPLLHQKVNSAINLSSPPAARKAELRRIARRKRSALGETLRADKAQMFPRHLPAALKFCADFARVCPPASAAPRAAVSDTSPAPMPSAYPFPEIIALYAPRGTEADCRPLMQMLWNCGRKLLLPAVTKQYKVIFRLFAEGYALAPGRFGIAEPADDAPALAPQAILLPLLAFDARGHRLGYGSGYYDRAIAELRQDGGNPPLIGLAFAAQELPVWQAEAHDIALDAVLTEQEFRVFAQGDKIQTERA